MARLALWALLVCALVLGGAWLAGSIVGRPANRAVPPPPAPARVVRLEASDGVRIEGSYWPGARADGPAVLLLHGINASREMFDRHAAWLNGLGYAVLAIDFRGHGGSGAVERTFGWTEARDARAALAFLRKADPNRRVGVIGVSMGGAAALLGEDGPLPAEAMILQAVYPDLRTAIANRADRARLAPLTAMVEPLFSYQSYLRFGVAPEDIAPIEGVRRYSGRLLVIGGAADRDTTVADSRALHHAAPEPKALWLVDGADHVETSELWSEAYRRRVRRVFAGALGEPRSSGIVRDP